MSTTSQVPEVESRQTEQTPAVAHHRVRNGLSAFLIAIITVLSAVALVTVWLSTTVLDTDRYVKTVAPFASDPTVQSAVAERVTDELFAQEDVTAAVKNSLPPNAQPLAAPLTAQLHDFVEARVSDILATQVFSDIWSEANRVTHAQITSLLLNERNNGVLTNTNGVVSIDLHAVVITALDALEQNGVTLFQNISTDKIHGNIELVRSENLDRASTIAERLQSARYLAPLLLVGAIAGALALSTTRRKTIMWLGLSLIVGMLLVAGFLSAGHDAAVTEATKVGLHSDVADTLFETLTRFLKRSMGVGFALGAALTLGAIFTGEGRVARALQSTVHSRAQQSAHFLQQQGWARKSAPPWNDAQVHLLRSVIVTLALVVTILWSSPTVLVVLGIAAAMLIALFVVEVVRSGTPS